jgi:hypothetical protein
LLFLLSWIVLWLFKGLLLLGGQLSAIIKQRLLSLLLIKIL